MSDMDQGRRARPSAIPLSWIAAPLALAGIVFLAALPAEADPPLPPTPTTISSCTVPGCDVTAFIVAAIDGADQGIRGQAYNFTGAPIVAALVRAKERGVDLAMLLDKISPCQKGEGADALAAAGIPVAIDRRPRIAHNKVLIIDGERVIEGVSISRLRR
jgi:phosphatidylserine/phosphatidylglycerophosphate/cardiolipin synthase-like enzyme